MAIFNTTGGSIKVGNSDSCKLTITVPEEEGTYVKISRNKPTNQQGYQEQAVSGNSVTFSKLNEGKWYMDIKSNIHPYSSIGYRKSIYIKSSYETTLSYFFATVIVHIPRGLTCTASIGTTELHSYSDGTIDRSNLNYDKWTIQVEEGGEWTFKLNTGLYEKLAISNGEEYTIDKWYLYKNGEQYSDFTGGWQVLTKGSPTVTIGDDCITIEALNTSGPPAGRALTNQACNLMGFKTLCAKGIATKYWDNRSAFYIGFDEGTEAPTGSNIPTLTTSTGFSVAPITGEALGEYQLQTDISSIISTKAFPYFIIYCAKGTFNSMWVEF